MMLVAILALSLILLTIAALHILWAIGFWWPIRDEARLTAAVVGAPGMTRMPGAVPCALVAVALITAAWWPWFAPAAVRSLGLWAMVTVFALRGIAPWLPVWRRLVPQEPFATLDRRAYGPLCLLIAALMVAVAVKGP
jgi:hypothetical protein